MPIKPIITTNTSFRSVSYTKPTFTIYILCLFVFIQSVDATTIIPVRTTTGDIFIGADSKEDVGNKLACKIKQFNELFFAFAGRANFGKKNIAMFDAFLIANEAANTTGSIRTKIQYFDKHIQSALENVIGLMFRTNKPLFNDSFKGDKSPALCVVIAGVLNNKPVYFIREYKINIIKNTNIKIKIVKVENIDKPAIDIIGTYGAIEKFAGNTAIPKNPDPSNIIERLITLQSEATPSIVGLPVDILRITIRGAKWIQHKPECPEIQKELIK